MYGLYGCVGVFLKNLKNEIQGGIAALVEIRKQISETTRTTPTPRTLWLKSIRMEEVRQDQVVQRDGQSPAPSVRGVRVVWHLAQTFHLPLEAKARQYARR